MCVLQSKLSHEKFLKVSIQQINIIFVEEEKWLHKKRKHESDVQERFWPMEELYLETKTMNKPKQKIEKLDSFYN